MASPNSARRCSSAWWSARCARESCLDFRRRAGARAHGAARGGRRAAPGSLSWAFVWLCASLALVAVVDVPLQLFQFKRALRMTRQELRDESKELDGRPETKQRIRQMQQTLARRRMMHKVPTADVVIVNPTHFAVALKYDPKKMRAPRGAGEGRRSGRAEHPPHRRGTSRAGIRVRRSWRARCIARPI